MNGYVGRAGGVWMGEVVTYADDDLVGGVLWRGKWASCMYLAPPS